VVTLVFCLRRLPELSLSEFEQYWLEHHGPLVRSLADTLRIRRYIQFQGDTGAASNALASTRTAPTPFDGIAQLWFDTEADILAAADTPSGRHAARQLIEDERRFIDHARSPIWLYHEHVL
jgi:uncharacterized protein (TIGR02118 family)